MTGIHPPLRPRYPGGMSAADPVTPGRCRFATSLPRPLWIGAAGVLAVVAGRRQIPYPGGLGEAKPDAAA
jgi:hypothetical protein